MPKIAKNKRLEVLTKILGEGEKNICQKMLEQKIRGWKFLTKIFGEGKKNIGHKICWNQKIRGWEFSPNFWRRGEKYRPQNMLEPKNKRLGVLTKFLVKGRKIYAKNIVGTNKRLEVLTKIFGEGEKNYAKNNYGWVKFSPTFLVKGKNIWQKYVGTKKIIGWKFSPKFLFSIRSSSSSSSWSRSLTRE